MSNREDDKEQRKQERLRRERAATARQKRRRIVQVGVGALLAGVVIAAVIVTTMGDSDSGARDVSPDRVALPAQRTDDLTVAVKAAGCTLRQFDSEGQEHVAETTRLTYKTNPPTSGDHFQVPAQDGVHASANPPETGNWVHSLEHGRVLFQYRQGTSARRVRQLDTLLNEPYDSGPAGYHTLLLQNTSRMPFAVAAVAWTSYVACGRFTDRTFDALRAFRTRSVDRAPEQVP